MPARIFIAWTTARRRLCLDSVEWKFQTHPKPKAITFAQMIMRISFIILCLALQTAAFGQDLHYSQFYLNPIQLNPAATGMFKGDLRAAALYRSQWRQVPVAYQTYTGAFDWKAMQKAHNQLSVGFLLQNDEAGDAGLSWLQLGATVAVAHSLGEKQAISAGFGLGFVQRGFSINGLTFKNQWGGDAFDPNLPTNEHFNQSSGLAPSLSAGLHWQFAQTDSRSRIDVSSGIVHLNKPVVSLGDFDNYLSRRISFFANGIWQVHSLYDVAFFSSWQKMGTAQELLFGGGIRRILTSGLANETVLQLSMAYRQGDAIIPAIQLERNSWTVGISYDVNVSAFDAATHGRGGIEIAVNWRRIPVPIIKTVKSCPVF